MSENTKDASSETSTQPWWKKALEELPVGDLKSDVTEYVQALAEKGTSALTDKLNDFAQSMTPGGDGAGGEGLKEGAEQLAEGKNPASAGASALATGAKEKLTPGSSGGGGSSDVKKFSNIVETVDVGVPIRVAYNQWTQFQDWTDFMKKVENAQQEDDEKLNFKGQVFLSHRSWESTIVQQVPDEQIVWESTGEKGHLDGAVTFHELAPRLTRILIIVNYYPQGFVEKLGNMGRPVGRRIRVESRLFARYVMTQTILDEDSVEGWRGEIRDSEVVRTHEEAVEAEEAEQEEASEEGADTDEAGTDEADTEDEGSSEEAPASEEETEPAEDEQPDDEEPEDAEPEDEEPEEEESEDAEPEEDEPEDAEPKEGASTADEEPAKDDTADDDFEYVEEDPDTTGGSS